MKSIGVVRKIDPLGRIVIPKELRRTMDIPIGTPMEIFKEDDAVIIRKYAPARACAVTGQILPENQEFAGGLILSPEGARQLLSTLKVASATVTE